MYVWFRRYDLCCKHYLSKLWAKIIPSKSALAIQTHTRELFSPSWDSSALCIFSGEQSFFSQFSHENSPCSLRRTGLFLLASDMPYNNHYKLKRKCCLAEIVALGKSFICSTERWVGVGVRLTLCTATLFVYTYIGKMYGLLLVYQYTLVFQAIRQLNSILISSQKYSDLKELNE